MFDETVQLDFSKLGGLAPVVLQHAQTREPLMVGFVDEEAWRQTVRTGVVTLYRRTLGKVEVKGTDEGSEEPMLVERLLVDCDEDTALIEVLPEGSVCHFGGQTCFINAVPRTA